MLRDQVGQLLDHGHTQAWFYPIGRVWEESYLLSRRIRNRMADETTLLNLAVSAVIDKDSSKRLKDQLKKLRG